MHVSDKLFNKNCGVFNHYASYILNAKTPEEWRAVTERIDVKLIARQLYEMGAEYCFITLEYGTNFMLASNKTYDGIFNAKSGDSCTVRDVVNDLYEALSE